jgi:hypothetical protein
MAMAISKRLQLLLLSGVAGMVLSARAAPGRYLEVEEFLEAAFDSAPAETETLFVDADLRGEIESVLGHRFSRLRLRYWEESGTTAWILDEIGKTEPITIGVAVEEGRVRLVRILEFRESRGWEVRFPFFTAQYVGAELDSERKVDRHIDGITGATLSVTAVEKVVRTALICDERVRSTAETTSS